MTFLILLPLFVKYLMKNSVKIFLNGILLGAIATLVMGAEVIGLKTAGFNSSIS